MTVFRWALAGLCTVLVVGCSEDRPDAPPKVSAPPGVPCRSGAQAFWLPDASGGRLEANSIGGGSTAVVFLHEAGAADMCGFASFASSLAQTAHVRSVLINRCGYGQSSCPTADDVASVLAETQPAIDWAREHGAQRVVLLGASNGGGDAMVVAGSGRGVDALVDLSDDGNDIGVSESQAAARVDVPSLFAVAPGDPYVSIAAVRRLFLTVPGRPKRLVNVRGAIGQHGWDLLADPTLYATITRWVTGHY
jgi:hypothetical protein